MPDRHYGEPCLFLQCTWAFVLSAKQIAEYFGNGFRKRHLGMTLVYKSKRDWWIVALIWAVVLLCAIAAAAQFSGSGSFLLKGLYLVLLAAVPTFLLWIFYGTDYTLTDYRLLIRCGPFRYEVPLAEIDLVVPSRSPLSSPACSLDRLLIKWDDQSKKILVSPSRKQDLLREINNRCAQLRLDGSRLTRDELNVRLYR